MADGAWIGVDLDGTLAVYDDFKGVDHIGDPVAEMVSRVQSWLCAGIDVRIFTARVDGGTVAKNMGCKEGEAFEDIQKVRATIEAWCLRHIGKVLPITNQKDYGMVELWDDRAVQVIPNTGHRADGRCMRGKDGFLMRHVRACSRCGGEHQLVPFSKLATPIECGDRPALTHWATCPTNHEPILCWLKPTEVV